MPHLGGFTPGEDLVSRPGQGGPQGHSGGVREISPLRPHRDWIPEIFSPQKVAIEAHVNDWYNYSAVSCSLHVIE